MSDVTNYFEDAMFAVTTKFEAANKLVITIETARILPDKFREELYALVKKHSKFLPLGN